MKARELVSWNIRRLRVSQRISSEGLAAAAGVDRVYLGRIERGIANPSVDVLERLASALGVEMVELFAVPPPGTDPPPVLPSGRRRRRSNDDDA